VKCVDILKNNVHFLFEISLIQYVETANMKYVDIDVSVIVINV